jgi:hypothetical protein
MLTSGFAEAVTIHGKRPRIASPVLLPDQTTTSAIVTPSSKDVSSSALTQGVASPSSTAVAASLCTATTTAAIESSAVSVDTPMSAVEVTASASRAQEKVLPVTSADGVDEDDELDVLIAAEAPNLLFAPDSNAEIEYRQITVRGTAWSTFRAVLLWLETGEIRFSLLGWSTLNAAYRDEELLRLGKLLKHAGSFHLAVSPASVYVLCHLVGLDDLAGCALDEFRQQLSVVNIAEQLFSKVVLAHNLLKQAAFRFATANWSEVKRSNGFRNVRDQVAKGELPEAAPFVPLPLLLSSAELMTTFRAGY